jgi:hypothetical protein
MTDTANTPNVNPPGKPAGGLVLTKQQLTAILVGAGLLLIVLVAAIVFLLVDYQRSILGVFPTLSPASSGPTTASVGAASVPTYSYRPTFTPIPTQTPFSYRSATRIPATSAVIVQATQPSGYNSNCQAQLDYAASVHQTNATYYRNYYQPWIDYYNQLIQYAEQTRDALQLAQAQAGLNQAKADLQSYLTKENNRYKQQVASIKASC